MFIINLKYKVELTQIDQFLNEHIEFLNAQYESGNFLASGRKEPRTGGIIKIFCHDEVFFEWHSHS
jgi:uncharacterized protein YciI